MFVPFVIVAVLSYLLGALPFGYVVARAKGVNIFEVGSRNPGATNVRRMLGHGPGNLVLALDVLKGALASSLGLFAHTKMTVTFDLEPWGINAAGRIAGEGWLHLGMIGLVFAIIGHSFPCFTRFRGGKGVATGAGGVLMLMPFCTLFAGIVWLLLFLVTRYVSVASMLAAVSLPLTAWLYNRSALIVWITGVIALFVIIRHRENIRRLLNGTENRMGMNAEQPPRP